MIAFFQRASAHGDRRALVTSTGNFTYRQLLDQSARVAACLLDGAADLGETRVAFLAPPGLDYVALQWGIWQAGGIAVPLAVSDPPPELDYVISDADADIVVAHPDCADRVRPLAEARGRRFLLSPETVRSGHRVLPSVAPDRRAMIVYTSGTTSKPKGVVTTHANIQAQVETLVTAWEWTPRDTILHVLPLHHLHGIINALACALWSGATCEILPRFDAERVWDRLGAGAITLFMAVPTIYAKLIAAYEAAPPDRQQQLSAGCARLRLMVCGSAALPVSTLETWRRISGQILLERYGMTETGMILANPLHGERRPGFVGVPLPGVEVRLAGDPGEIHVRGRGVFREYWRRPDATAQAFQAGWFRTGDLAVAEHGMYRMLGRSSVDIIKTGGYKVSALEIEEVLRTHPAIQDCAVVAVPDDVWGECVHAAVVCQPGRTLTLEALRAWAKERLAVCKIPAQLTLLDALPRNALGKVMKPDLVRRLTATARG